MTSLAPTLLVHLLLLGKLCDLSPATVDTNRPAATPKDNARRLELLELLFVSVYYRQPDSWVDWCSDNKALSSELRDQLGAEVRLTFQLLSIL